jgi:signal transduction histidine kinase
LTKLASFQDHAILMEEAIDKTTAEEQAAASDPVLHVLAEVIGCFTHDLKNSLAALHIMILRSQEGRPFNLDEAGRLLEGVEGALEDFSEFVRPYRRNRLVFPLRTLKGGEIHGELEKLANSAVDGRVGLTIAVENLPASFEISRLVFRNLILPLLENSNRAVNAANGAESAKQILVSVRPLDEFGDVLLVVSDNGPGWGDRLEAIRERLQTTSFDFGVRDTGGFGLVNLNRLIRRLGGHLLLSSNEPSGARAEIRLPGNPTHGTQRSN